MRIAILTFCFLTNSRQFVHAVNRLFGFLVAFAARLGVERGDDLKSLLLKSAIRQQRQSEMAGAHENHRLQPRRAEFLGNLSGKVPPRHSPGRACRTCRNRRGPCGAAWVLRRRPLRAPRWKPCRCRCRATARGSANKWRDDKSSCAGWLSLPFSSSRAKINTKNGESKDANEAAHRSLSGRAAKFPARQTRGFCRCCR